VRALLRFFLRKKEDKIIFFWEELFFVFTLAINKTAKIE